MAFGVWYFQKSGQVVIALSKRQNTKPAQAGAKGNMTFLLLGSLQNILWVLRITHFSIKRALGLQSRLLPTSLGRGSLWLRFSERLFPLWLLNDPLAVSSLPGAGGGKRVSVVSSSSARRCLLTTFQQSGWEVHPVPWPLQLWVELLGNFRESCAELLMPPGR